MAERPAQLIHGGILVKIMLWVGMIVLSLGLFFATSTGSEQQSAFGEERTRDEQ